MGEPVRLMLDLPNEAQMLALFVHVPGGRLLVASEAGDGFVLPEDEAVAQTRGRPAGPEPQGRACAPASAGRWPATTSRWSATTASCWSSPPPSCPRWAAARASGCSATRTAASPTRSTFDLADGLSWKDPAGRTRTVAAAELAEWIGARASAGRMAPRGFPRENRFD